MTTQAPKNFSLGLMTLCGIALCAVLAYPFLPALAWSLALAVIAYPIHRAVEARIPRPNTAAAITTLVVMLILFVPVVLLSVQLGRESLTVAEQIRTMSRDGRMERTIRAMPYGPELIDYARSNFDPEAELRRLAGAMSNGAAFLTRGTVWMAVQWLVVLFVLFHAFRDRQHLQSALAGLIPLPPAETGKLFRRVADSIHATVYATLMTGTVQGVSGGLLFLVLGLPAPVLWGVAMGLLGIVPLVGAFLVWIPAAVFLALNERWAAALALVVWGGLMAGPVGNWLYAHFAGDRMRLHPVPVLLSFVGGLAIFGVTGMVVGPLILVVTIALLDVWRNGSQAEPPGVPASPLITP